MEDGESTNGTVTPFSELFPVEETQRAIKHVEDLIKDKRSALEVLTQFIAENASLINLITKLPEELHHNVMVPFGKAAFLPGRLVHTNEFMVLLGEGYFAERSAKQTTQILKRREEALESQVESLKANIKNLTAEATFFAATASGANEGLVEIKEDYAEDQAPPKQLESHSSKDVVKDDEYAMMMSRFDELEREERAAEGEGGIEEAALSQVKSDDSENEDYTTFSLIDTQFRKSLSINKSEDTSSSNQYAPSEFLNRCVSNSSIQSPNTSLPSTTLDDAKFSNSNTQSAKHVQAFTGSIVERTDSFKATTSQDVDTQPSKPVSRFKMQRQ